ncbi:unnamed protein product [Dovyalis caffra]|uniref:Uncharacterized protein n=1 Tax=Dovyalis caffra TaxID=77055 RepID=A0AAV1RCP2_9ROSI|nr:unnamed protein product [Dovyalis caffra]
MDQASTSYEKCTLSHSQTSDYDRAHLDNESHEVSGPILRQKSLLMVPNFVFSAMKAIAHHETWQRHSSLPSFCTQLPIS